MIIEPGLRDRKKAATRAALGDAAARLARRLGIDCVTADAIASEAGVSTRTFHNYFSSKEEAVLSHFEASVHEWLAMLAARPADEDILDSLENLVVQIVTDPTRPLEETTRLMGFMDASPALVHKAAEMHVRISRLVSEALAKRTGTDVDRDIYPTVLHMVVGGACKAALEIWAGGKSDASGPEELIHDAFRQIRAGLPAPSPRK
ncbi:AcrR family transcriptional regulator [Rhodococcus sp. 27YEA15]|uniref:TetR/AcrR family transcriptional regulator n=1 Tax=Rhodococcus sp. 27YEA15 TaxID=3156259 RepID=UPI003C7D56E8